MIRVSDTISSVLPNDLESKSRLRVFMLPTFDKFNKYCCALVENLRREGVDIRCVAEWTPLLPLVAMFRRAGLPQIVHLHWIDTYIVKPTLWKTCLASGIFLFQLLLLKMFGAKIVWTIHDYFNVEGKFIGLDIAVRRITTKFANIVIVHTAAAKEEVRRLYSLSTSTAEKIKVIPHGNFVEQYENTRSRAESRESLGLDRDLFVFGFIGYVRPYKGVLELIKAFRQIDKEHLRLVIAGMPFDTLFADLVRDAARGDSRIHLHLKFIDDQKLQIFLNAVDVVTFPYTRSLTPGSLILAMSFGKAVVAADHAAVREILPPDGGLIYPANDFERLVRVLREIQTKDLELMGKRNLEQSIGHNWRSVANATAEIYREVTKFGIGRADS